MRGPRSLRHGDEVDTGTGTGLDVHDDSPYQVHLGMDVDDGSFPSVLGSFESSSSAEENGRQRQPSPEQSTFTTASTSMSTSAEAVAAEAEEDGEEKDQEEKDQEEKDQEEKDQEEKDQEERENRPPPLLEAVTTAASSADEGIGKNTPGKVTPSKGRKHRSSTILHRLRLRKKPASSTPTPTPTSILKSTLMSSSVPAPSPSRSLLNRQPLLATVPPPVPLLEKRSTGGRGGGGSWTANSRSRSPGLGKRLRNRLGGRVPRTAAAGGGGGGGGGGDGGDHRGGGEGGRHCLHLLGWDGGAFKEEALGAFPRMNSPSETSSTETTVAAVPLEGDIDIAAALGTTIENRGSASGDDGDDDDLPAAPSMDSVSSGELGAAWRLPLAEPAPTSTPTPAGEKDAAASGPDLSLGPAPGAPLDDDCPETPRSSHNTSPSLSGVGGGGIAIHACILVLVVHVDVVL